MTKKIFVFLGCLSKIALAGSSYSGNAPKSFMQMGPLQTYEMGILTSVSDSIGRFNSIGELNDSPENRVYNLAVGATTRVGVLTDLYLIVPFITRIQASENLIKSSTGPGDIIFGARHRLVDSLFEGEWAPKITGTFSLKVPTGTTSGAVPANIHVSGTGNGLWEPTLGALFFKDLGQAIVAINPSVTLALGDKQRRDSSEFLGHRIEVSETATIPITPFLTGMLSLIENWSAGNSLTKNLSGRGMAATVGASYFLNRLWSVAINAESSITIEKFSVNQAAVRTLTFQSNYSIF